MITTSVIPIVSFLTIACSGKVLDFDPEDDEEIRYRAYFSIAEKKCAEYSKIQDESPLALAPALRAGASHVKNKCDILGMPLIIGGTRALYGEFPHQAEVGFLTPGGAMEAVKWFCGGSLISDKYVMSAAHCITSELGLPKYVRFGLTTKLATSASDNIYTVVSSLIHPNYTTEGTIHYDDIALIQIAPRVEFSEIFRPACLNIKHKIGYETALASGFGKLNYFDSTESLRLMKVVLDIINKKTCVQLESSLISSQICATVLTGGKDTCQGDSGGPLQVILPHPLCTYNIVGITSHGRQCGHANTPAIYTRVSYYVPWIVHVVWGATLLPCSTLEVVLGYKAQQIRLEREKAKKEAFLSEW